MSDGTTQLLNEIHRALGRIEGNQEQFLITFKGHIEDDKVAWRKLDALAEEHSYGKGRLSVVASICGVIAGAIAGFFGRHV